jgi:NAD(P) transhydrogenase
VSIISCLIHAFSLFFQKVQFNASIKKIIIYPKCNEYMTLEQKAIGGTGGDMTDTHHYDLIVIGGGPAGQGAVEFAAFARLRTLVIERKVLGGLVVTTGGGPTKTLREAALHLTGFRYRGLYGLTEQPDIGMAVERTRTRTREVSSAMQNFTHSVFVDTLGVDVIYGSASLGPNHTVIVTSLEGSPHRKF